MTALMARATPQLAERAAAMGRTLLNPWYLVALVTLTVNDRYLKALFPGLVTGKLSDFAGVFVVAVALGALTGRRVPAVVATAVGFTAIKLSATAAQLAAPVLGGVTLQDATDLVGLVTLVPAYRMLGRLAPAGRRDRTGDIAARPDRIRTRADRWLSRRADTFGTRVRPTDVLRAFGLVAMWSATTISVTATSCGPGPDGYNELVATPDGIVAVGSGLPSQVSVDGGATWVPFDGRLPETRYTRTREVCLANGRCFQLDSDGIRTTGGNGAAGGATFAFTESELDIIEWHTAECGGTPLFSDALVAQADGREFVLVAMGPEGILRFDPGTDTWSRVAVGEAVPTDLSDTPPNGTVHSAVSVFPLAVMFLSPALILLRRKSVGLPRRAIAVSLAVLGGGVTTILMFITVLSVGGTSAGQYAAQRVIAGLALMVVLVALAIVLVPTGAKARSTAEDRTPVS